MNVWYHLSTIFNQRYALRIAGLLAVCVAITTTLLFTVVSHAAPGINKTLSFQGRLLNSTGGIVPDGHYNIQFKIYQDGTGTSAGNPSGTLKWTETYINDGGSDGIEVKNGYFSANLGSLNPFGNQVDWNQDTLWLSMNIAGSATACTSFGTTPCSADGEMLPMKRITATPFAINSGAVGGKSVDQLVQLGQGTQTDSSNNSSVAINKTGTGNLVQLQNNGADAFTVANNGDVVFGNSANHSISVASAVADAAGSQLSISAGSGGSGTGSAGGNLVLQGGASGGTDANGGNITLSGGAGSGTGAAGLVILSTPTFSTVVDDANCHTSGALVASSCTVTTSSVNGSSAVIVGFSTTGQTAVIPDPTITTAGRTLYIMAADSSENFILAINGGGAGNEITMTGNTAATLMWNGADWVVAGTSSASAFQGNNDADSGVSNIQIGDGEDDGSPTLLTVDKASSAPTITNTTALLGSMYYDTTLDKLQCYETDGWGNCTDTPDTFVTLSPEYTNAVMNGTDLGTITSDLCSDTLNINDANNGEEICGTDETYNFYKWTTTETTDQTRSIYVTYKLPSNFKEFVEGSTSLMGRTNSTNSSVTYQVYKDESGNGLTACGSAISVSTGIQSSWQQGTADSGNDPANCGFEAGDSLLIRINLTANDTATDNASAYVSNLAFTFSNN